MVTASARRRAVDQARAAANISERQACRYLGVARSSQRYVVTRHDTELRARLETLALLKPRWGYRRLHWLLGREGSRESPGLLVDVSLSAPRLTQFLDSLPVRPTTLVCDNGPEFTSQHFDQWAHARGITLQFIRPGKPIENC